MTSKSISEAFFLNLSSESESLFSELSDCNCSVIETLCPVSICEKFFELRLRSFLSAISHKIELNGAKWRGTSISHKGLSIRFDRNIILHLMQDTLGIKDEDADFTCSQLSELERKVLERVLQEILDESLKKLIEIFGEYEEDASEKKIHLLWCVENGKMILSVPKKLIKKLPREKDFERNQVEDFATACALVRFVVGKSQMKVSDLKAIERGDLIVLRDSSTEKLSFFGQKTSMEVKINSDILKRLDLPEGFDLEAMGSANKNLLGDFELEVEAEFKDVRMKLNELLSLEAGNILEIGKISDRDVLLVSQGKTIARGELVAVNDKFGMLVKEVFIDK